MGDIGGDIGPLAMKVNVLVLQIKIMTGLQIIIGIILPGFSGKKWESLTHI